MPTSFYYDEKTSDWKPFVNTINVFAHEEEFLNHIENNDIHVSSEDKTLWNSVSQKAEANHTHGMNEVSGLQNALNGKANSSHTHAISNIVNLQTILNNKANASHTHAVASITGLQIELNGKASTSHTHPIDNITGLQGELNGKANSNHTHTITDVTNLQETLNGKASTSHTHTISDIQQLQEQLNKLQSAIESLDRRKEYEGGYIDIEKMKSRGFIASNNMPSLVKFDKPFSKIPTHFHCTLDIRDNTIRGQYVQNVTKEGFEVATNYAPFLKGLWYEAWIEE